MQLRIIKWNPCIHLKLPPSSLFLPLSIFSSLSLSLSLPPSLSPPPLISSSLSFSQGLGCIVALDVIGLIRGWRMLDHAAHLGGAAFGMQVERKRERKREERERGGGFSLIISLSC